MKVQIAFDKKRRDGEINFVRVGRTIWPVRSVQVSAPMSFIGMRKRDKYGDKQISLHGELLRGVDIKTGEIFMRNHLNRNVTLAYFNPADKEPGLPGWQIGSQHSESEDEISMEVFTHPYLSLMDEPVLICTEYDSDQAPMDHQIITSPDVPEKQEPSVGSLEDYVRKFDDG